MSGEIINCELKTTCKNVLFHKLGDELDHQLIAVDPMEVKGTTTGTESKVVNYFPVLFH